MKKSIVWAVIVSAGLFFFGCATDDVIDIVQNGISGPEEYYEMLEDYWVNFSGVSPDDPVIALLGELHSVAGMLEEFFEGVEWDSEDGLWVYEYANGDVVTRVEIDTSGGGEELPAYWSVKELGVLLWEGNATYHTVANSLTVLFTTSGRKVWFEFVESAADDGYFTYIAYEDLDESEVYIGKMWFLTDLSYITGRINTDYPTAYPSFEQFTANVAHIYNNPPASWDAWKTMPDALLYFEFSWDPTDGYAGAWIGLP